MAQAIGYLIAPILTRIYVAEEMGELAIYMRAVGFIAAAATLRYELSLPLPKRDAHSFLLYRLSFRIALVTIAVGGVGVLLFALAGGLTADDRFFYGMVLSSALFLVATNLGTYWAIRMNAYGIISRSKVFNALFANGFRWLFGVWGWSVRGLLIASLIGYAVASLGFIKQFVGLQKAHKPERSRKKTIALGLAYRDFPAVNLPHVMVDLGRELVLALVIAAIFSKEVFGWYSYAYTMLRLPVALLGASIGQVLMNRCSSLVNEGKPVYPLFVRTAVVLALLSVLPFSLVFMYGEPVFAFVFGANWATAGTYASIMAPWLMAGFVTSSLSVVPLIMKRQRSFFVLTLWGTLLLLLTAGVLPVVFPQLSDDFEMVLRITTYTQTAFSLVVLIAFVRYTQRPKK